MRNDLQERGGNKKESVYDIIERKKKKMRVRSVMDQKANSVADLAAVLLEQGELGVETTEAKEKEARRDREKEVKEMLALAEEAESGALQRLETEIAELQARLEKTADGQTDQDGLSKTKVKRELYALTSRKLRMEFAANAVRDARDPTRRQKTASEQTSLVKKSMTGRPGESAASIEERMLAEDAAHRVKNVKRMAHGARRGSLTTLSNKIERLQHELDQTVASAGDRDEEDRMRNLLLGLKLTRRQMELASDVASLGSMTDFAGEAEGIRVKTREYKVELVEEELRNAENQGAAQSSVEALQQALELARADVEELKATGLLRGEREKVKEIAAGIVASSSGHEAQVSSEAHEDITTPAPEATPSTESAAPAGSQEAEAAEPDWFTVLPSFPARSADHIPKRGHLRQKLRRQNAPIFSTDGITVRWNNMMDAEYAEAWPENVQHERMGWSRFTAPKAGDEAAAEDDLSGYKEKMWRKREANWLPVVGDADADAGMEADRVKEEAEARKEFVGGIKDAILKRIRAREEEKRERRGREMMMLGQQQGQGQALPEVNV